MKLTRDKLFTYIKDTKPTIVYVSGKTSTGKTTFSNKLSAELGYFQIEFDQIVNDSVVKKYDIKNGTDAFIVSYRDGEPNEWRESFINAAKYTLINTLKKGSLVAEGAIANPDTIKKIFTDELKDFLFIYFHPSNKQAYSKRIKERFLKGAHDNTSGLPKEFWNLIPNNEIKKYKTTREITSLIEKGINEYTEFSIKKSKERLELLQESFPEIIVVDA